MTQTRPRHDSVDGSMDGGRGGESITDSEAVALARDAPRSSRVYIRVRLMEVVKYGEKFTFDVLVGSHLGR